MTGGQGFKGLQSVNDYDFHKFSRRQPEEEKSLKLLSEEQRKRSKLEVEINKLNVYIEEQKKKLTEYGIENSKLKDQLSKNERMPLQEL